MARDNTTIQKVDCDAVDALWDRAMRDQITQDEIKLLHDGLIAISIDRFGVRRTGIFTKS